MTATVLLTHSRTRTLRDCAQRHYLRYELGIRPEGEPEALRIGSAIHAAFEAYGLAEGGLSSGVADGHEAVHYYYHERLERAPGDVHRSLGFEQVKIHELFAGWVRYWESADSLLAGVQNVAVEVPFKLRIPGVNGYRNAGKLDGIVQLRDRRLALREHKTTSDDIDPGSSYWDRLRLDSQLTRYLSAARQLGYDVQTIVYDVVKKPTIGPRASVTDLDEQGRKIVLEADGTRAMNSRTGEPLASADAKKGRAFSTHPETFEEYGERLRESIDADPAAYFARMEIPRLRADVEAFDRELADSAREHRFRRKSGVWPRNDDACHRMGRRKCDYLGICANHIDCSERVPDGFVRLESVHPELEEA